MGPRRKSRILWLSSLACNANSHALMTYPHIESFAKEVDILYHPLLPSRHTLEEIARSKEIECDILIIEGSLDPSLKKGGVPFFDILRRYADMAGRIVTLGTCASFGGIFSLADTSISGLHFRQKDRLDRFGEFWEKSVTLPGCPVHPETLVKTLQMIINGMPLYLDEKKRPRYFYGWSVHDGCSRNEYFEYKIGNHNYGEMEGCMFIDHGCRGPFTRGSCNKTLWNGIGSKTRAGQPCFGCTEPEFPQRDLWHTKKHMGIPANMPLGVPKRAYLSLAGIAKSFRFERFETPILKEKEKE